MIKVKKIFIFSIIIVSSIAAGMDYKQKIDQISQELQHIASTDSQTKYLATKDVIKKAIEKDHINPNDILWNHGMIFDVLHKNDIDFVSFLFDHGLNLTSSDRIFRDTSIVFYAKSYEMAKLLLQHGAQANARGNFGDTVFHHNLYGNADPRLIDLYSTHGADITVQCYHGHTALTRLIDQRQPFSPTQLQIAQRLVALGVPLDARVNGISHDNECRLENDTWQTMIDKFINSRFIYRAELYVPLKDAIEAAIWAKEATKIVDETVPSLPAVLIVLVMSYLDPIHTQINKSKES